MIIHIVKVKDVDKHGDVTPLNFKYCPRFNDIGKKGACFNSTDGTSCIGVTIGETLASGIENGILMLECRYVNNAN